jgi:tetratricopeptide (TPR) repeat protein
MGYLLVLKGTLKFHDFRLRELELAREAGERLTLAEVLFSYAHWLSCSKELNEAETYAEESEKLYKQIGAEGISTNSLVLAEIAWQNGDHQKAISLYMELHERVSILGNRFMSSICNAKLSIYAIESGDFEQALRYLEKALALAEEVDNKPIIALRFTELSSLYYLQGNREAFKQAFRKSLSFNSCFDDFQRISILMVIIRPLYVQEPEIAAHLLGAIHFYETESTHLLEPSEKRNCGRAEAHIRETLGDRGFEAAFVEGQKMSLDEALDLALKTVDEM